MLEVKGQLNALGVAQQINGSGASSASAVTYDNTSSGLTADDVQEAIDELASGGHTYSTTAQKIGKWTDNKDVYEIVIHLESTYVPKNTGTDFPEAVQTFLDGTETVINCQGVGTGSCVGIGVEYASDKWTGYVFTEFNVTDLIFTYTEATVTP